MFDVFQQLPCRLRSYVLEVAATPNSIFNFLILRYQSALTLSSPSEFLTWTLKLCTSIVVPRHQGQTHSKSECWWHISGHSLSMSTLPTRNPF